MFFSKSSAISLSFFTASGSLSFFPFRAASISIEVVTKVYRSYGRRTAFNAKPPVWTTLPATLRPRNKASLPSLTAMPAIQAPVSSIFLNASLCDQRSSICYSSGGPHSQTNHTEYKRGPKRNEREAKTNYFKNKSGNRGRTSCTFAMCTLLWCSISLSAKVRKVCTLAFRFGIQSRIITLSCSACSKSLICSTMLRQSVLPKQPGLQEPP